MKRLLSLTVAILAGLLIMVLLLYGVIGLPVKTPQDVILAPREKSLANAAEESTNRPLILFVGTSLTARVPWYKNVEADLRSCAPNVSTERLAKSGASLRWGYPELERRLAREPKPDVVVMEFNGNDAVLHVGLPLFMSKSWTRDAVKLIRQHGAVVYLSTMNPGWGSEALPRLGQKRYHENYREIAQEDGVGLIDTAVVWSNLSPERRRVLVPDNGHPTIEGMEEISLPYIVSALKPLICAGH